VTELPSDLVLPVDKPEGPTSHDVVGRARKALGVRRIGHTGTLDPFASGLLLLCVGKATRLAEYFSGLAKSYDAEARLGVRTDTLDRDGTVVGESTAWETLTQQDIVRALSALSGDLLQIPPQYSAKKVGGQRAYRMAREGQEVALDPVAVTVHAIELTDLTPPLVRFRVSCSSGTYVRALARDLGDALGVGAHLTGLRRTAIGAWSVAEAVPVDALGDAGRVARSAVPPLQALRHMCTLEVDEEAARRLAVGQSVAVPEDAVTPGIPVAVAHAGVLWAVGEVEGGQLHPRKVFAA
jgi:tRNA pseudouridine55 synthase